MRITRFAALAVAIAALLGGCVQGEDAPTAKAGGETVTLRLDYAYYNPASLVLREQKWLETDLGAKGATVTWQLSAGSNKANEGLRGDALDIGSTAGAAALVARANGSPIKTIDVFSQPEWAAIVVGKNSAVSTVAGLRGKRIAATKGTDPYFFLLQALDQAGLKPADVTVVNLQHADGRTAEDVITAHPDLIQAVVNAYGRARRWIIDNPAEAVALYAREAKISPQVAQTVLTQRTRLDLDPVPGPTQRAVLEKIVPVLVADANVKSEQDARTAIDTLFEPRFATGRGNP